MSQPRSKAILITGCSSGIGRATAKKLAEQGHTVYATARKLDSIEDLESSGCRLLRLDVTDEASMKDAVTTVESAEGAVGVLINNAGFGLHGAAEETPIDEVRRQFETNFFGLVQLTQMVLPAMRAQRWGRIVNVSSMGGKLTFPGGAYYHASKFALEAFSDVLRFEVRPFGIDVVVVEPGLIRTGFGGTAIGTIGTGDSGPYAGFNEGVGKTIHGAYEGPLGRLAAGPEVVARKMAKAATARRPRTRYMVPGNIRGLLLVKRLVPDRTFDRLLKTGYTEPKP